MFNPITFPINGLWKCCMASCATKLATLGAHCCWVHATHILCLLCTSLFSYFNCSKSTDKSFTEIKKRLEKDVDEVGKIAQNVKAKLEAINRDVLLYSSTAWYTSMFHEAKQPVIMLVLLFSDSFLSLSRT